MPVGIALETGCNVATFAVEKDKARNYKQAIYLYELAERHFLYAIEHESMSEEAKYLVYKRCKDYTDRADRLRMHLENWNKKNKIT